MTASYSISAIAATTTTITSTSNFSSRRTLIITLSTVCSVISVLLCIGMGFVCWKCRRRGLFPRGITPINDDEIETWKIERTPEKTSGPGCMSKEEGDSSAKTEFPLVTSESWDICETAELNSNSATAQAARRIHGTSLDNSAAIKSPKRSLSKVIIEQEPLPISPLINNNPENSVCPYVIGAPAATAAGAAAVSSWHQHRSEDISLPRGVRSARSLSLGQSARVPIISRLSLDQNRGRETFALSQLSPHSEQFYESKFPADVHARAPNSRVGLTDEMIPGDPSFLPSPRTVRRQPSRLTKQRPISGGHQKSASAASNNAGGGRSFWNTHTRNGRSNSNASGRSLILDGSHQQDHQKEEQVPPLPSALVSTLLPPQPCQLFHQRSSGDLEQANAVHPVAIGLVPPYTTRIAS